MTIFMLIMCVSMGVVLKYIDTLKTQDNVQERAYNSVLSIEDEGGTAVWTGSSIKAMIKKSESIDNQMVEVRQEEPIYGVGKASAKYIIMLNGTQLTISNIDTLVSDALSYIAVYDLTSTPKVITIQPE